MPNGSKNPGRGPLGERHRACRELAATAARCSERLPENRFEAHRHLDPRAEVTSAFSLAETLFYAEKIASAGLERDPSLVFLGPARPAVLAALAAVESSRPKDLPSAELPLPFLDALRRFISRLAGAVPASAKDFTVETHEKLDPPEFQERLTAAWNREPWRLFANKDLLRQEIRRAAALTAMLGGASRLLLPGSGGQANEIVARLIHRLTERTWGPFVTVKEGAPKAHLELIEWLPSWSTAFLPRLPAVFESDLPPSHGELPQLGGRARIIAVSQEWRTGRPKHRLGGWPAFGDLAKVVDAAPRGARPSTNRPPTSPP